MRVFDQTLIPAHMTTRIPLRSWRKARGRPQASRCMQRTKSLYYPDYISTDVVNFRPFLMADLDFRHKFVIDNPETPPYGPMFTNFGLL